MADSPRFLHFEDNPLDAEIIEAELNRKWPGCRVKLAVNRERFTELLAQGGFDLVLSDFAVPGFNGLEAMALVRQQSSLLPFILVSGTMGEEKAVEAMKSGATDFVLKDRLPRLIPSIERALREKAEYAQRSQAEEELRKKNEEIEQFIYTVSHDLRSPLVTVKTFMGYLEKDMAEGNREQLAQDIQFINGAADKMKLLLDELLELSRIGRIETSSVRVSLKEILSETLEVLAGAISERTVDFRLPDTDLMLFGDRPRLCQIWQNLVENAVRYSRDDTIPRIELGVQQAGGETIFSVRDNGRGIDPKYHHKIFGIFEKLDPKSPGAGLGLSMVQRIVEKCGGRIWVESEGIATGSCFFFTLPAVLVSDEAT
jgi:signal transduction histidine kinase